MICRFFFYSLAIIVSAAMGAGAVYFLQQNALPSAGGRPVSNFALLDQNGRYHQLYDYQSRRAVVLYSHDPGCPTASGIDKLNALRNEFTPDSVAFLLIDSSGDGQVSREAPDEKKISKDIPLLNDSTRLVAESLGIMRSGETVVIDPASWTVRYRGPIDDRSHDQTDTQNPTKNYLKETILALTTGHPVEISERVSVGCPIDFGTDTDANVLSYSHSIAPILQKRCVSCHQTGGIGPWAMESHASVKAWAGRMRQAIMLKQMPPWHADPSIGEFRHSLALPPGETKTLVRWINAGAPRGTGPDPLQTKSENTIDDWPLGEPDIILTVPTFKIPAEGILAWQYVKLPVPIEEDTWIRAVHMKPSNRQATHHIFGFVEYPKERKQEEPKWAEGANGFFAAYVPGFPVVPFPEGSGRLIPKGSKMIFQRHYLTIGHPTEDNLQLGLYLHDKPPAMEYKMATALNMGIRIPANTRAHPESASVVIPEDGHLHAIYPHMHYRGDSIRIKARYPDGREERLLSVPNYQFQWQMSYQLRHPKPMPGGTKVTVEAIFDNSSYNPANPDPSKEVRWGRLSTQEMLVNYMMYTTPRRTNPKAGAAQSGS
jgi:peroxiredoxin